MNFTAKQIARQRIQTLIQQAANTYKADPKRAQSYLWTARKVAMAARIRLPPTCKQQICKKCNTLLIPGESSRVRIKPRREPHVVVTCLECGYQTRIPLKAKKEKTKSEQNNLKNEETR